MDVSEIERKVFKQLLSNPDVLAQYATKVAPEDFTTPIIRNVMAAFSDNNSALTHYVPSKNFFEILLRDRFHAQADLEQVTNVLTGLASVPADTRDLDMLIRELKANRMCREMTQAIQKVLPAIKPDTVESAYNEILKSLLKLPLSAVSGIDVAVLKEVHDALDERVLDYLKPVEARIPTGILAFDAVMGGFAPSELVLISAGQGHGKSNIMLWWATKMVEAGSNVLYITIEMSYEQTIIRFHAIQTGFDTQDIANKRIPTGMVHQYFEKLIAASKEKPVREAFLRECETIKDRGNPHGALALAKKYKNRPAKMFIMDLPSGCTPARIDQEVQRLSMDNQIDVIFVDFINVMDPDFHHKDRARELAIVARELKKLARKNNKLVVTAAQLDTTSLEGTQDEQLTTDHVKYAKAISENADWMIAFNRTEEDKLKKQVRLQMPKHRHSGEVTALIEFDFATMQAIDLGFADGCAVPYGYLKNGMKTGDFLDRYVNPEPELLPFGSSIPTEVREVVAVGATGATGATGPTDDNDDPLNSLKAVFEVKDIKVEPIEDEPFI